MTWLLSVHSSTKICGMLVLSNQRDLPIPGNMSIALSTKHNSTKSESITNNFDNKFIGDSPTIDELVAVEPVSVSPHVVFQGKRKRIISNKQTGARTRQMVTDKRPERALERNWKIRASVFHFFFHFTN